mmetsp:Transcript_5222/g.13133  ORF Transcript_5222/g.13133 Transcript_5222/m.13133 type:complete len:246 (-) Transcript_5222:261-998(-)
MRRSLCPAPTLVLRWNSVMASSGSPPLCSSCCRRSCSCCRRCWRCNSLLALLTEPVDPGLVGAAAAVWVFHSIMSMSRGVVLSDIDSILIRSTDTRGCRPGPNDAAVICESRNRDSPAVSREAPMAPAAPTAPDVAAAPVAPMPAAAVAAAVVPGAGVPPPGVLLWLRRAAELWRHCRRAAAAAPTPVQPSRSTLTPLSLAPPPPLRLPPSASINTDKVAADLAGVVCIALTTSAAVKSCLVRGV